MTSRSTGAKCPSPSVLTTPACPLREEIDSRVRAGLEHLDWVESIQIEMTAEVRQGGGNGELAPIPGIKNAVAVSQWQRRRREDDTAVNLAIALSNQGASIGILDADVYGPNIPIMLGAEGNPTTKGGKISPVESYGLKIMSLGFMLEEGAPVIWRGPMIGGALNQLLNDVDWGELDYLIIDMPPGTGDASPFPSPTRPGGWRLDSLHSPGSGLQDVRRSISMWERLDVPVLGIVENMSYFINPSTDERIEIFGHGGAHDAATVSGSIFWVKFRLTRASASGATAAGRSRPTTPIRWRTPTPRSPASSPAPSA